MRSSGKGDDLPQRSAAPGERNETREVNRPHHKEEQASMAFTITVNGSERQVAADGGRSLLDVLRDDLGITGPKLGCGEGARGARAAPVGRGAGAPWHTPAGGAGGPAAAPREGGG